MEKLTASIVKEYQKKKEKAKTAGEFKAIGRDRCGLTDMEAIHILNGKTL